jgi:hypothetical protein
MMLAGLPAHKSCDFPLIMMKGSPVPGSVTISSLELPTTRNILIAHCNYPARLLISHNQACLLYVLICPNQPCPKEPRVSSLLQRTVHVLCGWMHPA